MSQLVDESFHAGLERNLRSTYWRVRRLVANGFMTTLRHSKTIGEPAYAITRAGLAALETRGHYLLALSSESKNILADVEVLHMIEINAIRIALMKAGILDDWKMELEIISENLVNRFNTRKDFDSIVTVRHNGRKLRFALEFEKTAKSAARYVEISQSILLDTSIDLVVYLAASQELLSLLAQEFRSIGNKVVFGLSNQFKTQLLETPMLSIGDHSEFRPFSEILTYLPEANDGVIASCIRAIS
jgi:hypothetical protein